MDIEKGAATATELQTESFQDPNIVDWDGPNDPENPLNWTKRKKVNATVSIALITLLTYEIPLTLHSCTPTNLVFAQQTSRLINVCPRNWGIGRQIPPDEHSDRVFRGLRLSSWILLRASPHCPTVRNVRSTDHVQCL